MASFPQKKPKQLHNLTDDSSLIQQCFERVKPLIDSADMWVVTNKKYADRIAKQGHGIPRKQIIVEPFPVGTNLAVGLGAMEIAKKDPEAVIVVGWADAYIQNEITFRAVLQKAQTMAPNVEGIILAVPAEFPATFYGYLKLGKHERQGGDLQSGFF